MFDLNGKKALITGSSQGIGFAIAKLFAESGAEVFVHGSKAEKCYRAAQAISGAKAAVADLSQQECAEELHRLTGDVDILVLNASMQLRENWTEITAEGFEKTMRVNVFSTLSLISKYVPHMKKQHYGRILTIGSVNQRKQNPALAVYAASKSAQFNVTENLARELAQDGITVNNIAPGVILTPRNSEALADEAYRKKVMANIPAGFGGTAEDIAPAALLLCSEEGRYITGADLLIDGGMHL